LRGCLVEQRRDVARRGIILFAVAASAENLEVPARKLAAVKVNALQPRKIFVVTLGFQGWNDDIEFQVMAVMAASAAPAQHKENGIAFHLGAA
jgi:hypothetical protein